MEKRQSDDAVDPQGSPGTDPESPEERHRLDHLIPIVYETGPGPAVVEFK